MVAAKAGHSTQHCRYSHSSFTLRNHIQCRIDVNGSLEKSHTTNDNRWLQHRLVPSHKVAIHAITLDEWIQSHLYEKRQWHGAARRNSHSDPRGLNKRLNHQDSAHYGPSSPRHPSYIQEARPNAQLHILPWGTSANKPHLRVLEENELLPWPSSRSMHYHLGHRLQWPSRPRPTCKSRNHRPRTLDQ